MRLKMADKGGITATSRIEHATSKGEQESGIEIKVFEPGDSVPEDIAKKLPEGTVAKPSDGQMGSQPEDPTKLPKDHPKRVLLENVEPPDGDQTRITQADIAIAMFKSKPKAETGGGGDEPLPGEPEAPENPAELPEPPPEAEVPGPRKAPGAAGPPPQASTRQTPPGPTASR